MIILYYIFNLVGLGFRFKKFLKSHFNDDDNVQQQEDSLWCEYHADTRVSRSLDTSRNTCIT